MKRLIRVRLFIFDCDGVLFDSRLANYLYYNKICNLSGRGPVTDREFQYVHMHTVEESVRYLFRDYPDLLNRAFSFAKGLSYGEFMKYMRFDPSLPFVLKEIKNMGFFLAISTNRSTTMPLIMKIFRLDKWFDYICSATDVKRPKPHPEGVKKILQYFRLESKNAIYIGDSKVDEEVSKNTNIPLIAFKNTSLNALFHVKHFYDLLKLARCIADEVY